MEDGKPIYYDRWKGVNCPFCLKDKNKLYRAWTTRTEKCIGYIRRYHKCPKCNNTFQSFEQLP